MLDYDIYQEKKKRYEKYEKEIEKEESLWEKEMLQLAKLCKSHKFLPVLGKDGTYSFADHGDFYPARYMNYNSLMITRSNISMIGWDQDGDDVGFIKVRLEDLFREDREDYFLALYEQFVESEKEKKQKEEEDAEKAMYEKLRKKYGGS